MKRRTKETSATLAFADGPGTADILAGESPRLLKAYAIAGQGYRRSQGGRWEQLVTFNTSPPGF